MLRKLALGGFALSSYLLTSQKDLECCGIIGMVAKQPVTEEQIKNDPKHRTTLEQFLCDGVDLLKNRGYDSAGIYRNGPSMGEGKLIKYADDGDQNKNCIDRVVDQVLAESGLGTIGIAHTRWATCGAKVSRNAHPHYDMTNRIYCVHNGIITNHTEIKASYLKGVKLTSETDTEVLVQYVARQVIEGLPMVDALKNVKTVAGPASQWGLVIIDRQHPDKIYTYTNGSPLLIGFSAQEDQIYVVSQKIAFQSFADCYLPTNDDQIFELSVNKIPQLKKRYENRIIQVGNPPPVLKQPPAPFKSFFSYEIKQQGDIVFEPDYGRIKETVVFGDYLTMVACGSSHYAGYTSEPIFKLLKCFKKFHVIDPAELDQHDITENETVVVISQSGETKDLIRIVDDMKSKPKVKTIGIVNVEGSTIARKVDFPIYINVGRQTCVAATKSFFHQVLNLIQLGTEVAEQKKSAPLEIIEQIREELRLVPNYVQETITNNERNCQQLAEILKDKQSIFILGKRESMAIAKEAALKIKELNYIHAEAMGAAEMKHGPIALINSEKGHEKETVVFLFILDNETYPYCMNALDQMHSRNAYVVVITDCLHLIKKSYHLEMKKFRSWKEGLEKEFYKNIEESEGNDARLNEIKEKYTNEINQRRMPSHKYDFILTVPHLKYMSPLLLILPIQIFVEKMAIIKGINPDFPRNLAKSVTV